MLTDSEIKDIAESTQSAEPGRDGYILPFTFARSIEQAVLEKLKAQEHIYTDNKQTLVNALKRIEELEAQVKMLVGRIEAAHDASLDNMDFTCRQILKVTLAALEGKV